MYINKTKLTAGLTGLLLLTTLGTSQAVIGVATFNDLGLTPGNYWNGSDLSGGFEDGINCFFHNSYNTNWGSWSGFSYSMIADTNTPGYANQYAAWSPGLDINGTGAYAVVFDSAWDEQDVIDMPAPSRVRGLYINNTTYAARDMLNGSGFTKKFGGDSGNDPDWFMLTISGKLADGTISGSTNFYLADYRFTNNVLDYIAAGWNWVDLTSLGGSVSSLHFTLSSSDNGNFGMNTPAYFAMDNLTVEPSPAGNDYNNDGIDDMAIFDQGTGRWFIRVTSNSSVIVQDVNWGWAGVQAVAGDYNCDGTNDLAVFDQNTGRWFIRDVKGDVLGWDIDWGWAGVDPVSGDFNGDGYDDLAVFDRNTGRWFIRSIIPGAPTIAWDVNWGWPGVQPVAGDYDGDGKDDLAIFDQTSGRWFISSAEGGIVIAWDVNWGWPGVQPVAGDYNGDGVDDLAVFDQNTGRWFICTLAGEVIAWDIDWGWPGVDPVAGDYNGDGKSDLAVFDQNTGNWFIRSLTGEVIVWDANWGWPGVTPVRQ